MSQLISGREAPLLGIKSSLDIFAKLKHESSRLQDGWHPYDTFNFFITAWHLFEDWPKSDGPGSLSRLKRQKSKIPKEMNLVLDVVRDLANGSKHFNLNPQAAGKRRIGEVHTGQEAGWYEYFFHEDLPAVTVEMHWYFSVRVLNNLVVHYFEWVFDDLKSAKEFPGDLLDAILYCNIAERRGGPSPWIWLVGIENARKTF